MAKEYNERIDALGGIRIPSGAAAGKVATSDASGSVSWTTPSLSFDFRVNGTMYVTPAQALSLSTRSTLQGSGSGTAVVSYTVGGVAQSLPFAVPAGTELAVTVSGMTGTQRVSFSLS